MFVNGTLHTQFLLVIVKSALLTPIFIIFARASDSDIYCPITSCAQQKCSEHIIHMWSTTKKFPNQLSTRKLTFDKNYECICGVLQKSVCEEKMCLLTTTSIPTKNIYFVIQKKHQKDLLGFINKKVRYFYCSQTRKGFLESLEPVWDTLYCYAWTTSK